MRNHLEVNIVATCAYVCFREIENIVNVKAALVFGVENGAILHAEHYQSTKNVE